MRALFESLVDLIPIYDVPPRRKVLGTPVLILQIVGMLPNIISHNGMMTIYDGVILVGGLYHFQLSRISPYKPHPSTAESIGAGVVKLLLELFEAAKCFFDLIAHAPGRRAA